MAGNFFGKIFTFSTWGESHGEAIGCLVDGVPSNIPLSDADIQKYLDLRRPGSSEFVSARSEKDRIKILSGVFEGLTTGTPISLIIYNEDARSNDYENIKDKFRPGHGDLTYYLKYGIRDYRGGGRASARETAMRVAAGAIARKILGECIKIQGSVIRIGDILANPKNYDENFISQNPFWTADRQAVAEFEQYLKYLKENDLSAPVKIMLRVSGMPAGLGEPVYDKLDADLAKAIMSINAVKSVQIGEDPFEHSSVDEMRCCPNRLIDTADSKDPNKINFLSNNAGGILAGISTGQDIILYCTIKATSSVGSERQTINDKFENVMIKTAGRHDPVIGIRGVPVVEAMVACTLADHYLRNRIY
jgi:chorismate synthase